VHNDERLATSFFEGHRGDGPTFIAFVIRPYTSRECGVTSTYLPKNDIGCSEEA
jgi:hypothetical protein